MRRILEVGETVELELDTGARIYVSASETGGFQVIGDSAVLIAPSAPNAFRIVIEPSVRQRVIRQKTERQS